jgi:hypothetical protein
MCESGAESGGAAGCDELAAAATEGPTLSDWGAGDVLPQATVAVSVSISSAENKTINHKGHEGSLRKIFVFFRAPGGGRIGMRLSLFLFLVFFLVFCG